MFSPVHKRSWRRLVPEPSNPATTRALPLAATPIEKRPMARSTHRPWWTAGRARAAAWLGVLALLVQAMLPAAAMAATAGAQRGERIVVCTVSGVRTITVGDHPTGGGKSFAGMPCQDCLAAAAVALPAPEPQIAPIVYAQTAVERPRERSWPPSLARAPPRPPGQGPPTA
jgi:hypothetical protein